MKNLYRYLFLCPFLVFCSNVNALAQLTDTLPSRFYLGLCGGFAYEEIGFSRFGFKIGGTVFHNWENDFIYFSYSQLSVLSDPSDSYGNSQFDRLELCYGRQFRLSGKVRLGGSVGLSYNIIKYFENDIALMGNELSSINKFGLPLSLLFIGALGNRICGCLEYKYNFISSYQPYGDLSVCIMFAI
jgi:hypothetical protein